MTTNYQSPRFAFFHDLRRSTYASTLIIRTTSSGGNLTEYQDERAVRDDYRGVLYNFENRASDGYEGGAPNAYPTWYQTYNVENLADPSGAWSFRPAFVPYALIVPAGHSGFDRLTISLSWQDSTGGEPNASQAGTLGADLDVNAPIVVEWDWREDDHYEDKDTMVIGFRRQNALDASNYAPPSMGELFFTRLVTPSRGPVSNWTHTESPNVTSLRSEAGVVTTWVQGKSLRRWSLSFEGLSNDVGTADPATGTPVGWNLEPDGGESDPGSDAYPAAGLVYDLIWGAGAGAHPFWFLPPNSSDWVLVRLENAPADVRNDFPAPGVRTTDSIKLDLVEVVG